MLVKKTYRLGESTTETISAIAQEKNCTETLVLENAVKHYSDAVYMQERATVIPADVIRAMQSIMDVAEQRINRKTNQVLSATAIELGTLSQVIAASLDVPEHELKEYRRNAVDWLKANQRVFRLEEVAE